MKVFKISMVILAVICHVLLTYRIRNIDMFTFSNLMYCAAFSIPVMILSVVFISPLTNVSYRNNNSLSYFRGYTLLSITGGLYIGIIVRIMLFGIDIVKQ